MDVPCLKLGEGCGGDQAERQRKKRSWEEFPLVEMATKDGEGDKKNEGEMHGKSAPSDDLKKKRKPRVLKRKTTDERVTEENI